MTLYAQEIQKKSFSLGIVTDCPTPRLCSLYVFHHQDISSESLSNKSNGEHACQGERLAHDILGNAPFESVSSHQGTCEEACEIIRATWPSLLSTLEALDIKLVLMPDKYSAESFSDPTVFGQIYYRMDSTCAFKWSEIIVHEFGHQYLFALTGFKGKSTAVDWSSRHFSSLRKEQRPLIAVFHAVIAEAFMLELCRATLNNSVLAKHHKPASRLRCRLEPLFLSDYRIIKQQGVLSIDDSLRIFLESTATIISRGRDDSHL